MNLLYWYLHIYIQKDMLGKYLLGTGIYIIFDCSFQDLKSIKRIY